CSFWVAPQPTRLQSYPAVSHRESKEFFLVFAIIFPAFTGMTAGVGLSGDLRNPRRSIPLGTISATLGLVVYILITIKLSPERVAGRACWRSVLMSKIAFWGPIIPIGLAAATISSAIGSILVAPRTLQSAFKRQNSAR
ncbi:MAG: hypothetical protein IPP40_15905, partial [bacterium]|nr:hypothetical protein [bacterium]